MNDRLRSLFDHLRESEQALADQETTLDRLRRERQRAHDEIWEAIDAELDTFATYDAIKKSQEELKESNEELKKLVLELTARLPPPLDDEQ
jgi:peptidoglycan hydrolase CwlO-like protein